MKRLLTLVAFFATVQASAQQVNPVPDYVFRNQMSVGRNAVTDTAAYFSIGPRYGATKGFMPPIVGDTATFSSGKRNGLLIFSVQKNKFLYWDSVRVQWSDMAGGSGSYILAGDTAAMLAPYLRKADTTAMLLPYVRHAGYGLTKSGQSFIVDTLNIATRAWRQKGLDSLARLELNVSDTSLMLTPYTRGSGTANYLTKFTDSRTVENSVAFDNGGTELLVNTTTDNGSFALQVQGAIYSSEGLTFAKPTSTISRLQIINGVVTTRLQSDAGNLRSLIGTSTNHELTFITNDLERMRISAAGNLGIGTINPSQKLDVSGITRVNGGTIYAQASGTESGGYQLNALTLGYDATNSAGWITAGGAAARTNLVLQQSGGEVLIRTISDAGDYSLQVSGNSLFSGNIRTAAPFGGTANDWRLGTVASVSPTSPNRTIEVSIGGTIYYIAAKTTND